jgi:hypothetical protein
MGKLYKKTQFYSARLECDYYFRGQRCFERSSLYKIINEPEYDHRFNLKIKHLIHVIANYYCYITVP